MPARTHRSTPGADIRLPWWALALPALAFTVLLALITTGAGGAPAPVGDPAMGRVLEQVHHTLPH
ncbi:hypothetical protein NX801_16530 [Streptomyces sp. LP05-1]|uniref:Uncharacterized protein n=1 Tax=Streptomyces pyxinae TaxID=2970734 RepID=A0ABT2CIJ8_9ACTN|nr:hypothetical protein [Streptomyces sp. LP05-1]MCS0637240.1 hypothetical protein [Streptomyces sp. LP05-1]